LLHNHPSGDPKPSRDGIEMTHEVKGRGRGGTRSEGGFSSPLVIIPSRRLTLILAAYLLT
jgi:hypothetical protein